MSLVIGIFAAVVAALLWRRGWGDGSWNAGPRVAAVAIMAAATTVASLMATWTSAITGWVATVATSIVSGVGQREVANVLSIVLANLPWLAGLAIGVVWVAAFLPRRVLPGVTDKEDMSWTLAWAGGLVPPLVVLGPPGVQAVMGAVTSAAVSGVATVATAVMQAGG